MNTVVQTAYDAGHAITQLDLWLFHSINQWSGNFGPLDRLVWFQDNIFKSGLLMGAYWWFWFVPEAQRERRHEIIWTFLGTIIALVAARALALLLPLRVRPMYTDGIDYHSPLVLDPAVTHLNMETWSSFPSDQAALFCALAFGLWRLSRPVGVVALAVSGIWVCLARVYLGIHFPSDVLVGAFIGIGSVYLAGRLGSHVLSAPVLNFERSFPQAFYPAMFLVTYEFGILFDDLRHMMHGLMRAMRGLGLASANLEEALAALVGLGAIAALTLVFSIRWLGKRRR